jgi:LCP family protein required for cell wall assembly
MPPPEDEEPQYTRYRARPRLLGGRDTPASDRAAPGPKSAPTAAKKPRAPGKTRPPRRGGIAPPRTPWPLRWIGRWTRRRIVFVLLSLLVAWVGLSLVLFLISSHFDRTAPPGNVASVLDRAGNPLTSVNNILVLGSDRRQKNSKEPGAETTGYGRSDTIMLIRTGGGHSARLSIPRDTVVEIPGHGMQKINAAHAYGGPALSISVIEHWLNVPINHLVEVNFENFPQLIDAMGGVTYTGGCVISRLDGGFSQGGYTLRLPAGTHHLNGKQALALARTRENLCAPNENDLQREEHQQALFNAMKSRVMSFSSFLRLPWIAWNTPPAIISDMSGPTLLGLFGGLAIGGTPPTRVLKPSGAITLPDGEDGLTVSEAERRAAVARFMSG